MTDVFMPCVCRALRLIFHKRCRCTPVRSWEAAVFTRLQLAGLCLTQVKSQKIVFQPSNHHPNYILTYATPEKTLPIWEASLTVVGLGPRSSQEVGRSGSGPERDTFKHGHSCDVACAKGRSLTFRAALETPTRLLAALSCTAL